MLSIIRMHVLACVHLCGGCLCGLHMLNMFYILHSFLLCCCCLVWARVAAQVPDGVVPSGFDPLVPGRHWSLWAFWPGMLAVCFVQAHSRRTEGLPTACSPPNKWMGVWDLSPAGRTDTQWHGSHTVDLLELEVQHNFFFLSACLL